MKMKNEGVTIIVALGTSLLVLALAFATLNSVAQSIEQANNIQRSTQLFFAAESGLEAAFFHHNARGQGTTLSTTADQTLDHDEINATTEWSLSGRATGTDDNSDRFYAEILRENQTIQIPLVWDTGSTPLDTPNSSGALDVGEDITVNFYPGIVSTGSVSGLTPDDDAIRAALSAEYDDFDVNSTVLDFGSATNEVLIDWSLSRKNANRGVETFIPTDNADCGTPGPAIGFICEDQFNSPTNNRLTISTAAAINGKILPSLTDTTLAQFWDCTDANAASTAVCSEFQITFRPLLSYSDSNPSNDQKIIGIPFSVIASDATSFPLPDYTVQTDVTQESFSQAVNLEIPERTSIGAFDYVIFD